MSLLPLSIRIMLRKKLKWWTQDQTYNFLASTTNPIYSKVLGILFIVRLAPAYNLHQAMTTTNLFSLIGSMVPLTAKYIRMIPRTKKMKCILLKTKWSVYCASSQSHGISACRETCFTSQGLRTPGSNKWEKTTCFYIYFIRLCIIQWTRSNWVFLWSRTHLPKNST